MKYQYASLIKTLFGCMILWVLSFLTWVEFQDISTLILLILGLWFAGWAVLTFVLVTEFTISGLFEVDWKLIIIITTLVVIIVRIVMHFQIGLGKTLPYFVLAIACSN